MSENDEIIHDQQHYESSRSVGHLDERHMKSILSKHHAKKFMHIKWCK